MRQPYQLSIGLRYLRAKRRNSFIGFLSIISIVGIALGITTLITVMSVMNGFEQEVRERILGMAAHVEITRLANRPIKDWEGVSQKALKQDKVIGAAPYVYGQVMLIHGKRVSGTQVRGLLPELDSQVSDIADHVVEGSLDDLEAGSYNMVIGGALARYLGVDIGDKIILIAPQARLTPVGVLPRLRRFTVSGIFEAGLYEYDRSLVLINLEDARRVLSIGDGVSGVQLKLDDMFASQRVTNRLNNSLSAAYDVSDWTHKHRNYFHAVQTEKKVMFVILTLIIAVAAFNIISTLVMLVIDKLGDIAILRTLGASANSILMIFFIQGLAVGVIGTILGVVGGVLLAINVEHVVSFIEGIFNTQFIDPSVYAISSIPSKLRWEDVLYISGLSFALSLLATIYPAWSASKVDPIEHLRYE